MPSHKLRSNPPAPSPEPAPSGLLGDVAPEAEALGEILRRIALGLTAALIVARTYWPAEARTEADSGSGLDWSRAMLIAALVAALGAWLRGGIRVRSSIADFGVFLMTICVVLSARLAPERRIALNFTWDWVAVAAGYFLLRNLPRTRGEVSVLIGILLATAASLAVYGLYQVSVELPRNRAFFLMNPREALIRAGIDPSAVEPAQVSRFKDRLLGSREPVATFALTNTLAGVLVGPCVIALVMTLRGLANSTTRRYAAIAAPFVMLMVVTLLLTKSRSAYVGVIVAMLGLAWSERGRASVKKLIAAGSILGVILAVLVGVAVLAGQLDRQILTESTKSLSYRVEYWKGAWDVIRDGPTRWLTGYGPGNFSGPYMKHKPIGASEEIADPHNLLLDVWSTAGILSLIGLVTALTFGIRDCFARSAVASTEPEKATEDDVSAPTSALWLLLAAGIGGPILALIVGQVSPFDVETSGPRLFMGLSARWLILVTSWFAACIIGSPLLRRASMTPDALALGAIAIAVNLLAAGGIAYASVALMLWGSIALGLVLRDDRPCGRLREGLSWGWIASLMVVSFLPMILLDVRFLLVPVAVAFLLYFGGRAPAFALVGGLTATLGTFFGTVTPFREAESAIRAAELADRGPKPDLPLSDKMYRTATQADPLGSRAWIDWAKMEFKNWQRGGGDPMPFTWHKIDSILKRAAERPRNPNALQVHGMRAAMARAFLAGPALVPAEQVRIRNDRVNACAKACALYPTSASLRADFAEALADVDRFPEAVDQGVDATALDDAMPHADKKLPPIVRSRLVGEIPRWRAGRR